MKQKTKKLAKYTALAATAAAGASALSAYVTTRFLMDTALDRDMPKIMKRARGKISGSKKDEKCVAAVKSAMDALASIPHEDHTISAADGVTLVGHYIPAENEKRILIAFHGWRSSWLKDFGLIADFWRDNGCSVLYVEQRGQNNSSGDHMGFGLTERFDCLSWVDHVIAKISSTLPIYLCGVSMGAATVLMASGLDMPRNVHGIIADCGFTSPRAIWKHVIRDNLHLPYAIRGAIADSICRRKIDIGSGDYSTVDALETTDIPVLFIHGSDDKFVPVEMTYENYAACASEKELLIVPGADHALSYYVARKKYEDTVKSFFEKHDPERQLAL